VRWRRGEWVPWWVWWPWLTPAAGVCGPEGRERRPGRGTAAAARGAGAGATWAGGMSAERGGLPASMTTLGTIGSGMIGGTVARLAVNAGYDVVLSNSRGPETLADLVAELGPHARAATAAEAAAAGDLVLVSIPVKACSTLPAAALAGKIVLDTGNYYPQRDGQIAPLRRTGTSRTRRELPPGPTSSRPPWPPRPGKRRRSGSKLADHAASCRSGPRFPERAAARTTANWNSMCGSANMRGRQFPGINSFIAEPDADTLARHGKQCADRIGS
jgi:hypothetical protein